MARFNLGIHKVNNEYKIPKGYKVNSVKRNLCRKYSFQPTEAANYISSTE